MSARAQYAPSEQPASGARGGAIASVLPGGAGAKAGLSAGSSIVAVNGHRLHDIIDWWWYADESPVRVDWIDPDGAEHVSELTRGPGQGWGIDFRQQVFDTVRTCKNRCAFCFMSQLPPGLRRALYLRDDDYRLSFLQGNFVTLTNLGDADVSRILEQRLSPLYVSVHATDPDVRRRLICASEDRALEILARLLAGGISIHAQIVLVPGVNDGEVLDRTLAWLAEQDGVRSVGVVPLGYTRFQTAFSRSYEDAEAAAAVLEQLSGWQTRSRERTGVTWVHAADEFYVNAGAEIPDAEHYDDFPQYENGIGLVRTFLDDIERARTALAGAMRTLEQAGRTVKLVTGTLAAPAISRALESSGNDRSSAAQPIVVLAVSNRFFGGNVSVAGLLTGGDIVEACRDDDGAVCLLPDVVLNADGLTLDDLTLEDIRSRSGADVRLVSSDVSGLLSGMLSAVDAHHTPPARK